MTVGPGCAALAVAAFAWSAGLPPAPTRGSGAVASSMGADSAFVPRLFGEGTISTPDYEYFTSFTPGGDTLYFGKASPQFTHFTILTSRREGGRWIEPEVAPFSGRWSDADPRVSPDGSRLYFLSNRPVTGDTPIDDLDLWVMERSRAGWGEPRHLGKAVNGPSPEWSPSVTHDGWLYFGATRQGGRGADDLWRARQGSDGAFGDPENLGDSVNTAASEIDPFVAPDGSWLVFGAAGRPDGLGGIDLYLSVSRDGVWSRARRLDPPLNSPATDFSPALSADGRTFFFTSTRGAFDAVPERPLTAAELERRLRGMGNGLGDLYQVDVRALGVEPPATPDAAERGEPGPPERSDG